MEAGSPDAGASDGGAGAVRVLTTLVKRLQRQEAMRAGSATASTHSSMGLLVRALPDVRPCRGTERLSYII